MSEHEHVIQDYVDGRMSESERREFERRLARDAELARRVETYREIGTALREEAPALTPGFYTRLRSRFESDREPVERGRWFRPLSWETAGLVAAAALAAALFVPGIVRRDFSLAPAEAPAPARQTDDDRREVKPRQAAKDELSSVAGRAAAPPAEEGARRSDLADTVEETVAEGIELAPTDEKAEAEFAPSPPQPPSSAPAPSVDVQRYRVGDERESRATEQPATPEPETKLQKSAGVLESRKKEARADAPAREQNRSVDPSAASAAEPRLQRVLQTEADAVGFAAQEVAGRPLARGLVEPGAVREITGEREWDEALRANEVGDESFEPSYDPSRRWVLVGARPALQCVQARLVEHQDHHEIRLRPADDGRTTAPHGCAFELPRDGRPVRVTEGP